VATLTDYEWELEKIDSDIAELANPADTEQITRRAYRIYQRAALTGRLDEFAAAEKELADAFEKLGPWQRAAKVATATVLIVLALAILAVPHEVRIVSAHRTPDWLVEYARTAQPRGLRVLLVAEGPAADSADDPRGLTALGFLGISDPLRPTVPAAAAGPCLDLIHIRRCRRPTRCRSRWSPYH